jgi:hypothetical protein
MGAALVVLAAADQPSIPQDTAAAEPGPEPSGELEQLHAAAQEVLSGAEAPGDPPAQPVQAEGKPEANAEPDADSAEALEADGAAVVEGEPEVRAEPDADSAEAYVSMPHRCLLQAFPQPAQEAMAMGVQPNPDHQHPCAAARLVVQSVHDGNRLTWLEPHNMQIQFDPNASDSDAAPEATPPAADAAGTSAGGGSNQREDSVSAAARSQGAARRK